MSKYPINKEFRLISRFQPPINRFTIAMSQRFSGAPGFFRRARGMLIETHAIPVGDGAEIGAFLVRPDGLSTPAPCLVYFHGGGFVMAAASYHYRLALAYAAQGRCSVLFVNYRLAPGHVFPVMFEDCYAAVCWAYDCADILGIDRSRMAVGGDSAGGTLAASVCQMLRDRAHPVQLRFQLLVYPFLDARGTSSSNRRFTDTPMWNASRSQAVTPLFRPDKSAGNPVYASPVEAKDFGMLPPAYIETAEFDCLHDDGVLYAQLLKSADIPAELHETKGTVHGYDILTNAPTSRAMIQKRTEFIRKWMA